MDTVLSGLSLLLALAIAGGLIALSRRTAPARRGGPGYRLGRHAGPGAAGRKSWGYAYTPLGYAFSWTFGAALFLVSGLTGYRLDRRERFFASVRWSEDYIWWQIRIGLVLACVAIWFWRKGLRELRSNVYLPELAGREASPSAPPSRRIERR
jgi:hypothetical protein